MNYLITGITGGLPISLDDLEYLQNNVKILTSAIGNAFSNYGDPIILYGAAFSINAPGTATPTLDYSAGALWYSNEIYMIDAVTGQALPAYMYETGLTTMEWDIDSGTSQSVTFKDGTSHNIYKYRKAKLVNPGASSWGISDLERWRETTRTYTETIYIGSWNMDSTIGVSLAHNLPDHTLIRSVSAVIFSDAGTLYDINYTDRVSGITAGTISGVDATDIALLRTDGGFFDSTSFNDTGVNRGYITVIYVQKA